MSRLTSEDSTSKHSITRARVSKTPRSRASAVGCLLLFGLPFALGGLFVGGLAAKALLKSFEARSWVEVPAEILSAELEVSTDSDSTTYSVAASYRYQYRGETFAGSRVSFHSGKDNIGSYHQDTAAKLKRARADGVSIPCYVNPENPREAVLFRQVRWGLVTFMGLFGLLFAGVGFGIMIFGFIGSRRVAEDERRQEDNPLEPWKWKPAWAEGRIRSSNLNKLKFAAGFALFWNLISLPVLFLVPAEITEKGNYLAALGLIFPLLGIGMIVWAIRSFLRWRRFGESVLEMPKVPGVVGGPLAGVIRANMARPPASSFSQTLSCLRLRRTGSGKNRSTQETVLWQERHGIKRSAISTTGGEVAIPVLFAIPYDARETDETDSDDRTVWRLEVTAEMPGIDYSASFEVPVFTTEESSPTFQVQEEAVGAMVVEIPDEELLRQSRVEIEPLPGGGSRFHFPMARFPGQAAGLTIFLLFWGGAIGLMINGDVPFLFPLIFALFGVLILLATLDLWLGIQQIDASTRGLVLRSGLVAPLFVRTLGTENIAEIRAAEGMRSGNRVYYDVKVRSRGGKERSAGKRLDDKKQAELIVRLVQEALGPGR